MSEINKILKVPLSNLYIEFNGTMQQRESAHIIVNELTNHVVCFENNPLYPDEFHFISSYVLSDTQIDELKSTKNIGLSDEERIELINELQRERAAEERRLANERSLFRYMPPEARLSNKQRREAADIRQQLLENPNLELTQQQTNLLQRDALYETFKVQYITDNANTSTTDTDTLTTNLSNDEF